MNPILWLEARVPGFQFLPQQDREAISNFSLLWSFFEARALARNASAQRILAATHEWAARETLVAEYFQPALQYFRNRYFPEDKEAEHFAHLHLRRGDNPKLVEQVLRNRNDNTADCVAAVLIIIYRYRNNLFHGEKWAYGLQGQLGNFTVANDALMCAIECSGA